ncbi:serine protease, S1-C subfamily, contains C-terminal PDZ domain [Variovorax sp. HW608]|uniref:S1C family serine protease n=1 Tax=Variovorax sp. HW608 TaxID=1034889 RepID=UPI00081FF154|nr:S1C family serine protease [Variovorax sp. HW608]SCK51543.1 serine protease, S1-C subfamily, contains C-terminal PDZ domain [Variovorax sp. HW608]
MADTTISSLEQLSAAMADAVAAASRGVVAVHAARSRASGFVWRDGLIVTSEEALPDEGDVAVLLPDGGKLPASIVGRDAATDVALLRVEGAAPSPIAFDAAPVRAGSIALAVGSQAGTAVAAAGVVSLVGPAWRSLRGGDIDLRIELDLVMRRSVEGALALDAGGRAIGMAVFGPRGRVLVIPGTTVERVASQLAAHGRVPRGYLGVALQPVKVEPDGIGAMVMGIDRDGPGAKAGVRQGDVILAWNGEPVRSVHMLLRSLGPASVGTAVTLSLRRAGEPLELPIAVGERPVD